MLLDDEAESSEGYVQAIDRLISKFEVPLEVSGVVVAKVVDKFLSYTTQFISLSSTNYQAVWWKPFHSPDVMP